MRKADVISHFKSIRAVAEALGITVQAVHQWPDPIPEGAAYKLESVTDRELCVNPSLYPARAPAEKHAAS